MTKTQDKAPEPLAHADWLAQGKERFGDDFKQWQFICPVCKHVAKASDWIDLGAQDAIAFSCVGRWMERPRDAFQQTGKGPCNYAGGGLFRLNPVRVKFEDGREADGFDFAPPELCV